MNLGICAELAVLPFSLGSSCLIIPFLTYLIENFAAFSEFFP